MRQRALLMVTIAASVLFAAPAHAQGWRWLEKLSGPGNFTGVEVGVKLFCEYQRVDEQPGMRGLIGVSLPCVKSKKSPKESSAALSTGEVGDGAEVRSIVRADDGAFYDISQRLWALGAGVSYLRGSSSLEYALPDSEVDRTVQLWVFEGFYDRRWTDRVDYGVSVGGNLFIPAHADSFTRLSVEPRLTFKLFDIHARRVNGYKGTVSLRLGLMAFFGEFDAEDFGAIPGSYNSGDSVEFGPSIRFIVDLDRNPFK